MVHVGCGDGRLTAALGRRAGVVVHGLDPDGEAVAAARRRLMAEGMYGRVAVQRWDKPWLPYADETVNLVVGERTGRVAPHEIRRVLAPGGVAYIKRGRRWLKWVKPWPDDIDEWTHYLHGPDNNAVADDERVGPPRYLRWVCGPKWTRSHDHLASVSAAVSSGGRLFYIVDEGPTAAVALPPKWMLVARDAFSGVLLWKRAIGRWENHLRTFRTGPPHLARRLVAVGQRVYVTLGYGEPVSVLDAATGRTVMVFRGTEGTDEIVVADGVVYLAVGDPQVQRQAAARRRGGYLPPPQRDVMALDGRTGRVLWRKSDEDTRGLMPATLCVWQGRVLFQNLRAVVCLDGRTGRKLWEARRPVPHRRPTWSAPTLVVYRGVVLSADRGIGQEEQRGAPGDRVVWNLTARGATAPFGELIALSIEDGRRLWSCKTREGYTAPTDVLVAGGLVWTGNLVLARDPGITQARDPFTGEVKLTRPPDSEFITVGMSHHRCYRNRATNRYLVLGRAGVELLETATGRITANHWVRGTCQLGVLPCNGLLYAPPHSCACYIEAKLSGFNALAAWRERVPQTGGQLERGPAYTAEVGEEEGAGEAWPTYRHDAGRSGAAGCALPRRPEIAWRAKLGGKLTAPVVAGGRVLVARADAHTLYALDAETGRRMWSFTADGRIDSPPTVWRGRVLLGARDGWVYCLRAADGELIWRLHAAPSDRLVYSYGQLESLWPVHGNVLVHNGAAYFVAGRNPYLDGGLWLYRVDAATGRVLAKRNISGRDPQTGGEPQQIVRGTWMAGALPDVLSTDGRNIYMRHRAYDPETLEDREASLHLFSPAGFLDDSWWHRTYWVYGTRVEAGWGGWPIVGNVVPSGRILCVRGDMVYGFGRIAYGVWGSHVGLRRTGYRVFAAPKPTIEQVRKRLAGRRRRWREARSVVPFVWLKDTSVAARAMLVGDGLVVVAGPRDHRVDGILTGVPDDAAALVIYDAASGDQIAQVDLPACPVFDSLAAAGGRLYLTTLAGEVVCLGEEK